MRSRFALLIFILFLVASCNKFNIKLRSNSDAYFDQDSQLIFEEAGTGTVNVTLSKTSSSTVSVNYSFVSGLASTSDFTGVDSVLTFAPGEISKPINFSITNDVTLESDETFEIRLQSITVDGKVKSLSEIHTVTISDNDLPGGVITNVTSTLANGYYRQGQVVSIQVTFDQTVTVDASGGSPTLLLETGATDRNAVYTGGSGTSTLSFEYTVQAGDSSADLEYTAVGSLALNGATFKNSSRNNMVTTLPAPAAAGSLSNNKNIYIDTANPTAPAIADGIIHFSSTKSSPFVLSGATDANSGIASYEVKIGTTPGGNEIADWGDVGLVTWAQILASFSPQTTYYTSARAVDRAGNKSASGAGDGWRTLQQNKFIDPTVFPIGTRVAKSMMGSTMAISEDGLTMVIGYPSEMYDTTGYNPLYSAGLVQIYTYSVPLSRWILRQQLQSPSRLAYESYGGKVAISGNYLAVSTNGVSFGGEVHLYEYIAGNWEFTQSILPTGPNSHAAYEAFGKAIALNGTALLVGSSNPTDENGNNSLSAAGAVYYFERVGASWVQVQKIVASGINGRNANDGFGSSLKIDGDTLVVGATSHGYDETGANLLAGAGAVFVYRLNGVSGLWEYEAKVVASGLNGRLASNNFGGEIAIKGDELFVYARNDYDAAGANPLSDAGSVYAFSRSGAVWTQVQKIVGTGANGREQLNRFGQALTFDGTNLLVGSENGYNAAGAGFVSAAGAIFHFKKAGAWNLHTRYIASGINPRFALDRFGTKLALGSGRLISAAPYHDYNSSGTLTAEDIGNIFTFELTAGNFNQVARTSPSKTIGSTRFGSYSSSFSSIAFSEDGQTLVVGASSDDTDASGANFIENAGAVFVYRKSAGTWALEQKIVSPNRTNGDTFGSPVSISGDSIAVGAAYHGFDSAGANYLINAGSVHVFTRTAGVWSHQQKITPTGVNARRSNDFFGRSLSLKGDDLLVGSVNGYNAAGAGLLTSAGAVYYFTRSGSTWTQAQKLVSPTRALGNNFSKGIAIEGATAVITDNTKIEEFTLAAGTWSYNSTATPTGVGAGGNLGFSIARQGSLMVVSAPDHQYDGADANPIANAGAAYVFRKAAGVWSQETKLVASGLNSRVINDRFGGSVALDGDLIAVGVRGQDYDDDGANYLFGTGAAYLFQSTTSGWQLQQRLVPSGLNARSVSGTFGNGVALGGTTLGVTSGNGYDLAGGDFTEQAGSLFVYSP